MSSLNDSLFYLKNKLLKVINLTLKTDIFTSYLPGLEVRNSVPHHMIINVNSSVSNHVKITSLITSLALFSLHYLILFIRCKKLTILILHYTLLLLKIS